MKATTVCTEEDCERPEKARGLCPKHYKPLKKFPPQAPLPHEVRALLAAAMGPSWIDTRNVALLWVLYKTGMRIAEALALRPADIDWSREPKVTISILHGKGDKTRTVVMGQDAIPALKAWLECRAERFPTDPGPLFCSGTGRQLQTSYARKLFARLARDAKIARWIHPHGLRHAYAADAMRKNIRPDLIQRQLGHTDLATTTKYLLTIAPEEVVDALWDL